jgi:hypothetical protein
MRACLVCNRSIVNSNNVHVQVFVQNHCSTLCELRVARSRGLCDFAYTGGRGVGIDPLRSYRLYVSVRCFLSSTFVPHRAEPPRSCGYPLHDPRGQHLVGRGNMSLDNPNPEIFERQERPKRCKAEGEPLDAGHVFEFIRDIQDPEHPYSLEQLNVVKEDLIILDHGNKRCQYASASLCTGAGEVLLPSSLICRVQFTPTIDHCSLATLIGLCIRTQLIRKLPKTYKLDVSVRLLLGRHKHQSDTWASSLRSSYQIETRSLAQRVCAVFTWTCCIHSVQTPSSGADHRRGPCIRGPSQQAAQ